MSPVTRPLRCRKGPRRQQASRRWRVMAVLDVKNPSMHKLQWAFASDLALGGIERACGSCRLKL